MNRSVFTLWALSIFCVTVVALVIVAGPERAPGSVSCLNLGLPHEETLH